MKAIDISNFQGNVNMKRVRDEGKVERVILRAGWGKNNWDPKYEANAQAMLNLNIPGGIYWFSYAFTEAMATNEGHFAVEAAKKFWKKCYIAFDFEYDSVNYARKNGVNITRQMATAFAINFLKEVQAEGFIPVLYLNQDYWNNYFDTNQIKQFIPGLKVWYANWYSANSQEIVKPLPDSIKNKIDIWQFSSKGHVPGISGNVDMDEVYFDDSEDVVPTPVNPSVITPNVNIMNFQTAANADGYSVKAIGELLAVDGIDGPKTQKVRKSIALQAQFNRNTYKWDVYSVGDCVKWLQTRLTEMGFNPGTIDGYFGEKTRKATLDFQQKTGLVVDGIAGYNTLSMLFYV